MVRATSRCQYRRNKDRVTQGVHQLLLCTWTHVTRTKQLHSKATHPVVHNGERPVVYRCQGTRCPAASAT
jgi:hypothetical protein